MSKTAVIGAGSWGTALSLVLHTNGNDVTVWSIVEQEIQMLREKHEHVDKLPGVKLPEDITFTTDLKEAIEGKDYLILAVPSVFTRSTAKSMTPFVKKGQVIVCVAKGIEEDTLMTLSDIVEQEIPAADVAVMCGPSHAEEGLGYGDNTKAALITRGIFEISRLAIKMGANAETLNGLTGIGDLIVTCESKHSRNRKAGMLMGQGYTMKQAMDEVKMVVEGVYSAKAAIALARKYEVDMPIIEEINHVLFDDKTAKDAVRELMLRDRREEHSSLEWAE